MEKFCYLLKMENLELETNDKIGLNKKSFADRFSRAKNIILFLFWSFLILWTLKKFSPTLIHFYEITKAQESYYKVTVLEDKVFYQRTNERPNDWILLEQISKPIQEAIISSEDGKFYDHPGYDLESLYEAIDHSIKTRNFKKKKSRGASTITQQLVKNLFLTNERSLMRKGEELVMAIALEKHTNKKKILESYLNIIEFGKGLYGIGKATKYYFNKTPAQINPREAAFLAMLLPSPIKYSRSFKMRSLSPFAQRIVDSILLKMRQGGHISEETYLRELGSHFSWEKPMTQLSSTDLKDLTISEEETLEENL